MLDFFSLFSSSFEHFCNIHNCYILPFFLFVDLFVVSLTSWPSGGLMRDVPRRLGYLNTWSSFGGAVWEDWGGVSELDGGRMRVHRLAPLPVLSCFLPPAPASMPVTCCMPPSHDGFYPWDKMNKNKLVWSWYFVTAIEVLGNPELSYGVGDLAGW